jgi:hypothetical protein
VIARFVDTSHGSSNVDGAMSEPRKVEDPAGTYSTSKKRAKKPSRGKPEKNADSTAVRYLDDATAKHLADRIFVERKDLLHKLAQ